MFILFGFGKQTIRNIGKTSEKTCVNCHNHVRFVLVKVVDWFTLFFIPIIPYMTRFALVCPRCRHSREVKREDLRELFKDLRPMSPSDHSDMGQPLEPDDEQGAWPFRDGVDRGSAYGSHGRYEGKNATQIAYLSKLEARERELEAQRETEEADQARPPDPDTVAAVASDEADQAAGSEASDTTAAKAAASPDDSAGPAASYGTYADKTVPQALLDRERTVRSREMAIRSREDAVKAREAAVLLREKALDAREADQTQ